jgi:hypothetical protein
MIWGWPSEGSVFRKVDCRVDIDGFSDTIFKSAERVEMDAPLPDSLPRPVATLNPGQWGRGLFSQSD